MRIESDSLGTIEINNDAIWGAQTQRSINNFAISDRKLPIKFIYAMVEIKMACAMANRSFQLMDEKIASYIINAGKDVLSGKFDDQFPLDVYQTGSGTQTNMNVNEVLANIATKYAGGTIGSKLIHPNDHVNMGMSSNDSFPTAMHLVTILEINNSLLPAIDELISSLELKKDEFWRIIKIGRTHLQDAVPITLGQEFYGYIGQLTYSRENIVKVSEQLQNLAIGGTAVGTGLNAHIDLDKKVCDILSKKFNIPFISGNKFALIASKDTLLSVSAVLRTLAISLMKIANDIRWMASGPRAGLGELILPVNEPGSSIMPGKINPTQCEMIIQMAAQVIGNDTTVCIGAQHGYLELNLMKPVIISNIIESISILSKAMISFSKRAITGLHANKEKLSNIVDSSLMIVTALTKHPKINYDLAAKIAKKAHAENKNIEDIVLEDKILSKDELKDILNIFDMVNLNRIPSNE